MQKKFLNMKEPVNTLTHFITFLTGLAGLISLILLSYHSPSKLATMTIYGTSVILLYGASSAYHWIKTTPEKERTLRKLDHISIFLLIAGSYTPILYYGLEGAWRWSMLAAVWLLALTGISMKLFFMNLPRSVSTVFYITLGWFAIIPLTKLIHSLPVQAIILMIAGGVAYTAGGIIYATKICNFFPNKFGFHEIFHLFVTTGTVIHFIMMVMFILPL